MERRVGTAGDYTIGRWGEADCDAYAIWRSGTQLDWPSLPRALVERREVRDLLTLVLRESEDEAYFFECRPWREGAARAPFELVLKPTRAFRGMNADPSAFREHFGDGMVAAFDSLGGDARLVAPAPLGRTDAGLHLASFVRRAPAEQVDALWIAVGREIAAWRRAKRGTLWLSTSGLGVPWLHVRLDSRPKYYTHAPYR